MYYLKISLVNGETKLIEMSSLEEALANITMFEMTKNFETFDIDTSVLNFSFQKNKILSITIVKKSDILQKK